MRQARYYGTGHRLFSDHTHREEAAVTEDNPDCIFAFLELVGHVKCVVIYAFRIIGYGRSK